MKNALIIVDVQNDFCPGGALPVTDGDKIIPIINKIQEKFDIIVITQDWHPEGNVSFASTHNKQPFSPILNKNGEVIQILWPDHCVQGTKGSELHPDLNTNKANIIIRKGMDVYTDSYSAFFNNDHKPTGLSDYLRGLRVNRVFVCGLAADYCVAMTIEDSLAESFRTYLIEDATKPVDYVNYENSVKSKLEYNGCKFIKSIDL